MLPAHVVLVGIRLSPRIAKRDGPSRRAKHRRQILWKEQNGVCAVCGKRIDMRLSWDHPMGPSIDEIIPRFFGGERTRANQQLTHTRCNWEKGRKLPYSG